MTQKHEDLLSKITISLTFPKNVPITIDINSSFSNQDLTDGIANAVLLEAYDLAILSLQISKNAVEEQVKGMK